MTRPRAADDFAAIRARIEELRREREGHPEPEDARQARRRQAEGSVSERLQMDVLRYRRRLTGS